MAILSSLLKTVTNRDGFEFRTHARGKRFVLWIGKLTTRQQREWERHGAEIVDAFKAGVSVNPETLHWAASLPERIGSKLIAWGMLPEGTRRTVAPQQRTIGAWTELFISLHPGSERTKNNYQQARSWLLKCLDEKKDIGSVSVGDMKRWQASMSHLAMTTRNKHVKRIKTIFASACEHGLIQTSPAAALKEERSAKRIDRSRQFFVDAERSKLVLNKLPGTNWKLIFALMRFQGLRRHEVFLLTWENVNLADKELTIPAEGKTGWRSMPIFPEVIELLESTPKASRKGKVVDWSRSEESVTELLKRHVETILGECWPKVCQQLRSTRRTELDGQFEPYVVNEWLGHDSKTAERHYQQITPAHLLRASMMRTVPEEAVCTAACTAESHSTGAHSETGEEKNPGNPMKSRVSPREEYPRKDSNLGPAD